MLCPMNALIRNSLFAGAALLPAMPLSAEPAATPGRASVIAESKPYVLFMRTDVSVERGKKLYPIKDVSGRSFIISVNGRLNEVPMYGEPHNLGFQHALTLSRASASLTGLKSERAYTPGNDPRMVRQRSAAMTNSALSDASSLSTGKYIAAENKFNVMVDPAIAPVSYANLVAAAAEDSKKYSDQEKITDAMLASQVTNGAFARLKADEDMAKELFDAVEISFEVASDIRLVKPYLVVITRFHARNDKPGMARNAVFAKALESIGSKPRKIEVLDGGFPPGFEIEDLQVHLYNEGKEIATDVASMRVRLTGKEAFEYLISEYLSSHKGATLAATPALGKPSNEEQIRLTPSIM